MVSDDKLAADGRFIRQTYREVVGMFSVFQEAIATLGLSVVPDTPMHALMDEMRRMEATWMKDGVLSQSHDSRPEIAHAAGLADLLSKIVAVRKHPDFRLLRAHLELILGKEPFIQHYMTGKENEDANKVFELYMAAVAMLAGARIEVEDPYPKKKVTTKNPDVIATFRSIRWGLACKALHAPSARNYCGHIVKGLQQIIDSPVDRGVVVMNLKNVLPFDQCWPIQNVCGVIDYHCFDDHRDVLDRVTAWVVQEFHQKIVTEIGGVAGVREVFHHSKTVPQTLNFLPIVTRCRDHGECAVTKFNVFDPVKFDEPDAPTTELFQALNIAANHKAEHAVRRGV